MAGLELSSTAALADAEWQKPVANAGDLKPGNRINIKAVGDGGRVAAVQRIFWPVLPGPFLGVRMGKRTRLRIRPSASTISRNARSPW